jgi:pimeloyl-ACP methyl ester carboxylesterase
MRFAEAVPSYVEVKGARICYRLWGASGEPSPGLLFLHGFRAHSHWWDHLVYDFASDFRVASMDFSGFGDSDWRDSYSARMLAEEVLAVVAVCDIAPVTIVAHSFGATIAAHACALRPDVVRRLIMLDARMLIPGIPPADHQELRKMGASPPLYSTEAEIRARFRLVPPSSSVSAVLLDHIARTSYHRSGEYFAWKFDGMIDPQLDDDPNRWVPPGITTNADFVYGDRSAVVSPEVAVLIAAHFPNCGAPIAVPDCDHHILLEQPAALRAMIEQLVSRR